ncbi:hypothetical protein RND81_13G166800 [Saponaria officinalis]
MNSPSAGGHRPARKRLTTCVIEVIRSSETATAAPLKQSRRCWARRPSLPQEVPLGNPRIISRTTPEVVDKDSHSAGTDGNAWGETKGCLSCKAARVSREYGATPDEDKTLTAAE